MLHLVRHSRTTTWWFLGAEGKASRAEASCLQRVLAITLLVTWLIQHLKDKASLLGAEMVLEVSLEMQLLCFFASLLIQVTARKGMLQTYPFICVTTASIYNSRSKSTGT